MKTTSSVFTPTVVAVALLAAAKLTTHAQTTWEPLLPSLGPAPSGQGYSVLIDPFPFQTNSAYSWAVIPLPEILPFCGSPRPTPHFLRLQSRGWTAVSPQQNVWPLIREMGFTLPVLL